MSNGESIWRLVRAKYAPLPYFGNFSKISGRPKDMKFEEPTSNTDISGKTKNDKTL